MSDFSHGCPDCGSTSGEHYGGCSYDGSGNYSKFGAGLLANLVFALFVAVGLVLAVFCPPLGGAIMILGAKITGV